MAEIREYIVKRNKRNVISKLFHVKDDEKAVAAWRLKLDKIRIVFNVHHNFVLV